MANTFFRFKQFIIHQEKSAMKVCTDSCLFGSLLPDNEKIAEVLDIGAGTGLLSLMYAQKNIHAQIDAVEINDDAALEAKRNFNLSKWNDRLHIFQEDILLFSQRKNKQYDLIISNPPFFEKSLSSPNENKNTAHHSSQLTFLQLADVVFSLLHDEGIFCVLIPYERKEYFEEIITSKNLFIAEEINIKQTPKHSFFRTIFFIKKQAVNIIEKKSFTIKNAENQYTEKFSALLKDFYLKL